jgi:hypothetical protein
VKVYLASSARNGYFQRVRSQLVAAGHEVHDWTRGPSAYTWTEVGVNDPDACSVEQMNAAGTSDTLRAGLQADIEAIKRANVFVLLLPAGADAHFEMGWAARAGKTTMILSATGHLRASQFYGIPALTGDIYADVPSLLKSLENL